MSPERSSPADDATAAWEAELLVSAVAHDLKAPLVTIQGFLMGLESAGRANDWERFAADAQRIQRACTRMRQMLDDLREFARQGQPLREMLPMSFGDVVSEALEQLAGARPADVSINVEPDLPEIQGDRIRLLRVVQNVLENALCSVCERKNPVINISAVTEGALVTVLIGDNGQGIDPEHIPRMFQPYRQLSGRGGACGLGLSIAQRIMRAHGGELTLESPGVGHGATVKLAFPRP